MHVFLKKNHLPGLPDKHGKLNVCVINLISLCKSFLSDFNGIMKFWILRDNHIPNSQKSFVAYYMPN